MKILVRFYQKFEYQIVINNQSIQNHYLDIFVEPVKNSLSDRNLNAASGLNHDSKNAENDKPNSFNKYIEKKEQESDHAPDENKDIDPFFNFSDENEPVHQPPLVHNNVSFGPQPILKVSLNISKIRFDEY